MDAPALIMAEDPRAGVLLVAGPEGVDPSLRARAQGLVEEGYTVALLAIPDPERVGDGDALRRISAAQKVLPGPRLVVGLGPTAGRWARMVACALPGVAGVVEFGGQLVYPAVSPARPAQPLDLLPGLACPYQGHFGERDPLNAPHHLADLRRRLGFVAQPSQVFTYPEAGAAVWADGAVAELAWQRTHRFLDHLAP